MPASSRSENLMDVLALLAAVGVGGIIAGVLTPWIAGLMSGRQYSRQIDHETRMDELKRSHERQTQEQERQHQEITGSATR